VKSVASFNTIMGQMTERKKKPRPLLANFKVTLHISYNINSAWLLT